MKIFNNEFLDNKRINVLPFRSHFIPFKKDDKVEFFHGAIKKNSSSLVYSLNGTWNFKEYKKKEDFTSFDTRFKKNENITVPCSIQCLGYDHIQYLNCEYPFPFNPPYIDLDNPLFHYSRYFYLNEKKDNYYLVTEGIDNAFYLFINKKKVGYSLISHSKSEFDITKYLVKGRNRIDILVLKWSASSYFECQDKFRLSGIFRDIYILNRKKNHITDYYFTTRILKKNIYLDFYNYSSLDLVLTFKNKKYPVGKNDKISILADNVKLWTAEEPNLYSLKIESEDEIIYEKVGFRKVSVTGGVFKINDQHIKLKGVNRHESNPKTGAYVSLEDTYQDLMLMKHIGVNAIRTSHYPDIPEFYEMTDALGFYVLDEADVETHGAHSKGTGKQEDKNWYSFASKTENIDAIYDREVSLYERDKNRTSVVIFSLGNESSWGKMFFKGLDYIKERSDRPVHYEGVWHAKTRDEYYDKRLDFASRMYPSPKEMKEEHLLDKKEKRPIIMCEYSHAMGNSNGDLKDYWDLFYSSDRFAGGFIWEWCDHAIEVNGKLHYGGDDNDLPNDGNFCVDGLVTPYREFKSNTYEVEAIYKGKLKEDRRIDKTKTFKPSFKPSPIRIKEDDNNAGIKQIYVNDKEILQEGITLNFLRAPLDNDAYEKESFDKINDAQFVVSSKKKDDNFISYKGCLFNNIVLLEFNVTYTIKEDHLEVLLSYQKKDDSLFLPRVGIRFRSKKQYNSYTYFGYGKGESYIDKHIYTSMGEHIAEVGEEIKYNLKPQECGSRFYTSYINLKDMEISASKPFSFSLLPYSRETLTKTRHNYELRKSKDTYFSLDIEMAGVGTHSCGPRLDEKYWVSKSNRNTFKIYFK